MIKMWRAFRRNWGPNWCVIRHFRGGAYLAYRAWFIGGAPLVTMFFQSTEALGGEFEARQLADRLNRAEYGE